MRLAAATLPAILLIGLLGSGCVTVYQPQSSLQRPVVLDPSLMNLEGTRLYVRCYPGENFAASDAEGLCQKVGVLFTAQGAEVDHEVPQTGSGGALPDDAKPHLIVELRSRMLPNETNTALAVLSALSLTLVPTVSEYRFVQEVKIREPGGFLLADSTVRGRFSEYMGAGIFAVNWILDVGLRPDEDEVTGDAAKRQFSRDLYGQLAQHVFDARMRQHVLNGFRADPPPKPGKGR